MSDYRPIDCGLHDWLQAAATTGRRARLRYLQDGRTAEVEDVIVDVFTQGAEEFIRTRTGLVLRLDRILSLDHVQFDPRQPE